MYSATYSFHILMKLAVPGQMFEKFSNTFFMKKICPLGGPSCSLRADEWADAHDEADSRFYAESSQYPFEARQCMFILRESVDNCWHFSRFFFVTRGTVVVGRGQLHWDTNPTCVWPRNATLNQINFEVPDRLSPNFVFYISVWASFRANMAVV